MKRKIIVISIGLLLGLGFLAHAAAARAATVDVPAPVAVSAPAATDEAVISPSDAARLKRGLITLGGLLDEIGRRLIAGTMTAEKKTEVGNSLYKIGGSLATVSNMIETRTLALAKKQNAAQSQPLASAQNEEIKGIAGETEGAPQTAASENKAGETASVSRSPTLNGIIWPLVIIAAAAIAFFFWRARRSQKMVTIASAAPIIAPEIPLEPNPIESTPIEFTSSSPPPQI